MKAKYFVVNGAVFLVDCVARVHSARSRDVTAAGHDHSNMLLSRTYSSRRLETQHVLSDEPTIIIIVHCNFRKFNLLRQTQQTCSHDI